MSSEKFDYDFHRTRTYQWYEKYLYAFDGVSKPVLDVGAGIGLFLEACRARGVDCLGLEYEEEGVRICREKGFDCIQHDLSEPFDFIESNSVGGVFFNQVIEHLSPHAQRLALREIWRVLTPNGVVMVNSPCRHFEQARGDKYHISLLTPTELRTMLEDAGFVVTRDLNWPQKMPPVPDAVVNILWSLFRPDLLSQGACCLAEKRIGDSGDHYYHYVRGGGEYEPLLPEGKRVSCFVGEHGRLSVAVRLLVGPTERANAVLVSFKCDGESRAIPECTKSEDPRVGYYRYLPIAEPGAWRAVDVSVTVPDDTEIMTACVMPWGNQSEVFVTDVRTFAYDQQ
ncbi:MAG: class I SAM-dependent methyltransferase [bacterium]